jgi:MYXO-CTERM domain-containing protein
MTLPLVLAKGPSIAGMPPEAAVGAVLGFVAVALALRWRRRG